MRGRANALALAHLLIEQQQVRGAMVLCELGEMRPWQTRCGRLVPKVPTHRNKCADFSDTQAKSLRFRPVRDPVVACKHATSLVQPF